MQSAVRLLLYLPGMEGTGRLFYRQEPELSSRYKVVSLPSRSNPPFSYDDLVADVVCAIDEAGADKATIVAESFGGTVALQLALQHPSRVAQLVLINTFPYFRRRFRLRLGFWLLPLTFYGFGNLIREFVYRAALASEGVQKEDVQRMFECTFSHGYQTSRLRMQLIRELDVRERLHEIQTPVTLVASVRDKIVPSVQEARFMAQRMPNARVILLQEYGHTPLVTPTFSLATLLP